MSATIIDASRRRQASGQRALVAILAISVALNLCAIAGALWSRYNAPAPETASERLHRVANTLDLSPEQRATFDAYVATMVARGDRMRQEIEPSLEAAWGEVAKPDADQGKVLHWLDQAGNTRRAYQREAVSAMLGLLATLTPEQRAKFLNAERAFHSAMRRRRADEAH